MRIAFVTHQFFPDYYTGVERLTLNIANQLQRMGHECIVVTASEFSGNADNYFFGGVEVRTATAGATDLAAPWHQHPGARDDLHRIFAEFGADIVHVMHPMRLPQAFDAAEAERIPVVAHVADFGYLCPRINMLRVDGSLCFDAAGGQNCIDACFIPTGVQRVAWGKDLLARAARVVTPCRFTRDLHEANGYVTTNWSYIPWGVDYTHHAQRLPAPNGPELVVSFVGTLLPHKGPHVAIEAVTSLPGLPIRLMLYGGSFHEGGYEGELRKIAAGDERIVFAGSYEHDRFTDVLRETDLVVIPSTWHENLPTSGLNAIAAGVPLAVSDAGGMVELIEDYNSGFLFSRGDAGSLASLLERLVNDRASLARVREGMLYPPGLEEEAWLIDRIYHDVARTSAAPASSAA